MNRSSRRWCASRYRVLASQLGHNLHGSGAGLIFLVGRKADCSDASVASSAIALAYLCQVHHLLGVGLGPGIGADGDLGAEARLRQADGVGGLGIQVIGDELVEAFERMVGDVEEDGAVAFFGATADQRRAPADGARAAAASSGATKGCSSTSPSGISVSSGISRGMNSGSWVDSMMSVSFMAGAGHFNGGFAGSRILRRPRCRPSG